LFDIIDNSAKTKEEKIASLDSLKAISFVDTNNQWTRSEVPTRLALTKPYGWQQCELLRIIAKIALSAIIVKYAFLSRKLSNFRLCCYYYDQNVICLFKISGLYYFVSDIIIIRLFGQLKIVEILSNIQLSINELFVTPSILLLCSIFGLLQPIRGF